MAECDSGFYYVPYQPVIKEKSYPPKNDDIYCIEFYRFLKCNPLIGCNFPEWFLVKLNKLINMGVVVLYHDVERDFYRCRFNDGEYKNKMEELLGFVDL